MSTQTIKQGTKEWFSARVGKITASNVGAILGNNPHKSPDDVMREMVRASLGEPSEFDGNVATKYGNDNEDDSVVDYEVETGNTTKECGLFVHPDLPWLAASPDRLVNDQVVLEVKCPYWAKTPYLVIPGHMYYDQVQIQMECTQRGLAHFWIGRSRLFEGNRLQYIPKDDDWWAKAKPELELFYAQYLEIIGDPKMANLHLEPTLSKASKAFLEIEDQYNTSRGMREHYQKIEDDYKKQLLALADKKNIKGNYFTVQKQKGRSSLDKKKMALDGIDLSKYESIGKDSIVIRAIKKV